MSTTTLIAVTTVSFALIYYVVIPFSLRLVGSELRRRTIGVRQKLLDDSGVEESTKGRLVGFFHPYCNAGGGGERVLWAAIRAIQLEYPNDLSVVYTGDHDASKEKILENVQTRFSIELDPRRVTFLYLRNRNLVAANSWPHFTLLGQSLGSLMLAAEAFCLCVPDIFIDTMGYAFTLRLAKSLFNIPTCAYVHYPTISTDMLGTLPGSDFKTRVKRAYWHLFAAAYTSCGNSIDVVMANSSWTAAHMRSLWKDTLITTVFPPCAVSSIEAATPPSIDDAREKALLCIAQFRPEKNHSLLINAFALFVEQTIAHQDARLVLLGSVRHKEDAMRVYELRLLAREKGVAEKVVFVTDAPWSDVQTWLGRAWAGVNAMWNEHFGIGVVEYLAAGLVGVVHNSGGPKLDIVVEGTGYHCSTEAEFAVAFETALSLPAEEARQMRLLARETSKRFNEETFEKAWLEGFAKLKTA